MYARVRWCCAVRWKQVFGLLVEDSDRGRRLLDAVRHGVTDSVRETPGVLAAQDHWPLL